MNECSVDFPEVSYMILVFQRPQQESRRDALRYQLHQADFKTPPRGPPLLVPAELRLEAVFPCRCADPTA